MLRSEPIDSSTHGQAAGCARAAARDWITSAWRRTAWVFSVRADMRIICWVPHPRYLVDSSGIDPAWAATLSCSGAGRLFRRVEVESHPAARMGDRDRRGRTRTVRHLYFGALSHECIIAVDIDNAKLNAAKKVGAALVMNSRDQDVAEKIKQIAGGLLYGAVDLVGTAETASFSLDVLRKGGRLILVGLYGGEIPLSLVRTIQRAITIQGSHLGSVHELKQVLALAREGKLQPIPIRRRPLSEVSRTLDELKAGAVVGRVVVEM